MAARGKYKLYIAAALGCWAYFGTVLSVATINPWFLISALAAGIAWVNLMWVIGGE